MWKNISDETKALNSFLTFDIDPDSLMVDGITICQGQDRSGIVTNFGFIKDYYNLSTGSQLRLKFTDET